MPSGGPNVFCIKIFKLVVLTVHGAETHRAHLSAGSPEGKQGRLRPLLTLRLKRNDNGQQMKRCEFRHRF